MAEECEVCYGSGLYVNHDTPAMEYLEDCPECHGTGEKGNNPFPSPSRL